MPRSKDIKNNDPGLLILMSLVDGPRHGYALTRDIEGFAGVKLGPGTLYGSIARLEERGYISPVPSNDPRRRPYRITASGRRSLSAALSEMRSLTDVGLARLAASTA